MLPQSWCPSTFLTFSSAEAHSFNNKLPYSSFLPQDNNKHQEEQQVQVPSQLQRHRRLWLLFARPTPVSLLLGRKPTWAQLLPRGRRADKQRRAKPSSPARPLQAFERPFPQTPGPLQNVPTSRVWTPLTQLVSLSRQHPTLHPKRSQPIHCQLRTRRVHPAEKWSLLHPPLQRDQSPENNQDKAHILYLQFLKTQQEKQKSVMPS